MEKHIVTYQMYDHMMDKLVEQLELNLNKTIEYVYGPPRGGLPIAVHIAHHLNLEFTSNVGNGRFIPHNKILVVDDISDTGKTIDNMNNYYKTKFVYATLFVKDRSIVVPDFYVEKNNKWLVMPWERLDEIPNREGYNG